MSNEILMWVVSGACAFYIIVLYAIWNKLNELSMETKAIAVIAAKNEVKIENIEQCMYSRKGH